MANSNNGTAISNIAGTFQIPYIEIINNITPNIPRQPNIPAITFAISAFIDVLFIIYPLLTIELSGGDIKTGCQRRPLE
jgi:hypothetical protein